MQNLALIAHMTCSPKIGGRLMRFDHFKITDIGL